MFFGYPVERLCKTQYSLVSLVPGLLPSLQDCAVPTFDTSSYQRQRVESLKMSDRKSLLAFMGLPLPLFSEGAFFQPYCPLQQLGLLDGTTWVIGTTNSIFKQQREFKADVVVDLEQTSLDFTDAQVQNSVALTASDRKWMGDLIQVVQSTWNEQDPTQPTQMQFEGSDDYIRLRFEEYIFGFLSTAKRAGNVIARDEATLSAPEQELYATVAQFGTDFVAQFRTTKLFKAWDRLTDPALCDLIESKHPRAGKVSTMSDVALRLSAGIHDMRLEQNLGPTREAIGAALHAGGASLYKVTSTWRGDLARLTNSVPWSSARNRSTDAISTPRSSSEQTQAEPSDAQPSEAAQKSPAGAFSSFLAARQKAWSSALYKT